MRARMVQLYVTVSFSVHKLTLHNIVKNHAFMVNTTYNFKYMFNIPCLLNHQKILAKTLPLDKEHKQGDSRLDASSLHSFKISAAEKCVPAYGYPKIYIQL